MKMDNGFLLIAGIFISISLACQSAEEKLPLSQQAIQTSVVSAPKVYTFTAKPIWADEFDTPGLPDSKIWSYDVGGSGWGNNELQYYTEADKDNVHIENGFLTIEAKKENFGGKNYTSARIVSKGKKDFLYGKDPHHPCR